MSDIGMRRSNNQDAYAVVLAGDESSWRRRGHVFIVADGMGAHAAGELASKLAVDLVPHLYNKYTDLSPPEALARAIIEANAEIHRRGQANPEFHNMGTTASVLVLVPQGALIGHVGDSRVYRLRGEQLEQLTFDHSLVWEMKASGQIGNNSELAGMVPKNVITRSLGPNSQVKVDIEGPFPVAPGDTFLLCSDGLTGKVEDEELGPVLANLPPREAAQVLADLANLRGGPDNITLIDAKVTCESLATSGAQDEPLTVGAEPASRKVKPIPWVIAGTLLLGAAALAAASHLAFAAGAAVLGLGATLAAAIQTFGKRGGGVSLSEGRRLGKGPYVRLHCQATSRFVDRLAGIVQELRVAADEERWNVDMPRFNELCSAAATAAVNKRHSEAVRHYARAISFMMQQLRDNGAPEDSAVNL